MTAQASDTMLWEGKYRDVRELRFDNGRLVEAEDQSELMARRREMELHGGRLYPHVPPGRRSVVDKVRDALRSLTR